MIDLNAQRDKLKRWFTIGAAGLAALVVSPVIFMVVKGLIGLAIAGVVGGAILALTPYLSMKFANWRLKLIKLEASTNPIETMQNLLIENKKKCDDFEDHVEKAMATLRGFETKLNSYAAKYPARAEEFKTQYKQMEAMVDEKVASLKAAQNALKEGHAKLKEMEDYWEMSQSLQAAHESAGMMTGDFIEKLKADTAFDRVQESVNTAFAQMELASRLREPVLIGAPS